MTTAAAAAAADKARAAALDPQRVMHELVFCVPGIGKFALFTEQRKRFEKPEHAMKYASISPKPYGVHFALLTGTRDQVEKMPGMVPKADLFDDTSDLAANALDYRYALAIISPDGQTASTDVDDDLMQFVDEERAHEALVFLKKYCILPPLPSRQHQIGVIPLPEQPPAAHGEYEELE